MKVLMLVDILLADPSLWPFWCYFWNVHIEKSLWRWFVSHTALMIHQKIMKISARSRKFSWRGHFGATFYPSSAWGSGPWDSRGAEEVKTGIFLKLRMCCTERSRIWSLLCSWVLLQHMSYYLLLVLMLWYCHVDLATCFLKQTRRTLVNLVSKN